MPAAISLYVCSTGKCRHYFNKDFTLLEIANRYHKGVVGDSGNKFSYVEMDLGAYASRSFELYKTDPTLLSTQITAEDSQYIGVNVSFMNLSTKPDAVFGYYILPVTSQD